MTPKIVKGTRDLFGEEVEKFQFIEKKAHEVFSHYGYQEIRTPIMEKTELFHHGVGEDTDIVGKEMYLLEDRKGESLALRPEGTAPVVRSAIGNNVMNHHKQAKYYYMGPMFRFERPQKGRYRQFHQIGVESFGPSTPDADLELFLMLEDFFKEIQLTEVAFQINSIGCQEEACRPSFKKNLKAFFVESRESLCEDCNRRMETNPLRVLDCKVPQCREITEKAPKVYEQLCQECDNHFNELKSLLQLHGVQYELNARLVRGLDYYTRTVFEIYSANLGAQSAAGGGGRYDGLFETFGGSAIPGTGFGLGLDRLAMLIPQPREEKPVIFVVGHDRAEVSKVVTECRRAKYTCLYDPFQASMKSQFRQANKLEAKLVLVLGEEEIKNGTVGVKNMVQSTQSTVSQEELLSSIQKEMSLTGESS